MCIPRVEPSPGDNFGKPGGLLGAVQRCDGDVVKEL
jgi:hypothetical protein